MLYDVFRESREHFPFPNFTTSRNLHTDVYVLRIHVFILLYYEERKTHKKCGG